MSEEQTRQSFQAMEKQFLHIITRINEENIKKGRVSNPLSTDVRSLIVLCLGLFEAGAYRFSTLTANDILWLAVQMVDVSELNLLRETISEVSNRAVVKMVQDEYDASEADSLEEHYYGRLLQVLTRTLPRKIGPEKNWLGGA